MSGRVFGHQLLYFTAYAPLVLLEGAWKRLLRRAGIHLPWWLEAAVAVGIGRRGWLGRRQLSSYGGWVPALPASSVERSCQRAAPQQQALSRPDEAACGSPAPPCPAVNLLGDRLFWEPQYQLGTPARELTLLQQMAPFLKLKGRG